MARFVSKTQAFCDSAIKARFLTRASNLRNSYLCRHSLDAPKSYLMSPRKTSDTFLLPVCIGNNRS
jgi:hypothetical protein